MELASFHECKTHLVIVTSELAEPLPPLEFSLSAAPEQPKG